MCQRIAELRQAVEDYSQGFDTTLVTAAQADDVVTHAAAIEKVAAALKAAAAARVAETSLWRRSGCRSPAEDLARRSGTTLAQAADALATARRLQSLPRTQAAARRGQLSAAQASTIAGAAVAHPAGEEELVARAATASLGDLRDAAARIRVRADGVAESRRARIHAGRFLRRYTDADGAFNLHFRDNLEVGAEMMAVLDARTDALVADADAAGHAERAEAHAADALAELVREAAREDVSRRARDAAGNGARRWRSGKVLVRVDLPALLRGCPADGELCEIVGYGPVAASAVRDMLDCGDPFLAAVATAGEEVLGVAHLGRRPTAAQRTALEWLYPRCANEGCGALARLEFDHRQDWAKTHLTLVDLMDRLCAHDHGLKTRQGWALVAGRGRRPFVSPDDPRHPHDSPDAERSPPAG
ncbi:MAG TPA: DUF222 domain-containing protein [Acidimicrobiales bacterium]|nr:DUF222 domain-containing protein [Acidimicrobiales bacterium]